MRARRARQTASRPIKLSDAARRLGCHVETLRLRIRAGQSISYNPKNQTTVISGLSMTYTGATQTERVTAGGTNFVYNVLGCGNASTGVAANTAYTRDNKGQLLEERIPAAPPTYTPFYYLFDGLGSVVGVTDSTGTLRNTYTYGPYGEKGTWSEPISNPWHFAGGYLDSQTGIYKFGMRYYDPGVARWTQEDPRPGPNLYLYADDNPVNSVDPSGAFTAPSNFIGWATLVLGGIVACNEGADVGGILGLGLGLATVEFLGPGAAIFPLIGPPVGCVAATYLWVQYGSRIIKRAGPF